MLTLQEIRAATASALGIVAGLALASGTLSAQAVDRVAPTLLPRDRDRTPQSVSTPAAPVKVEVDLSRSAVTSGSPIFVGAVTISGLHELSPAHFSDIFPRYAGQTLSPDQLRELTNTIAERMYGRGFAFAAAWIEPQRVANGVLVVTVDEGRIDELRFDGPVPPSVRRALEPLLHGAPVRKQDVERRLLLTGDIDGVRIRSSRYFREGRKGVLLVRATQDRASLRAGLANQGSKPIGPEQARIDLDLNGLLASDDSLTLSYTNTPAQPRELQFGYVRYAKRIRADGTELSVTGSASATHPGAYLTPYDLRNRSLYSAVGLLHPLLRRRDASFWLEGELGIRNLAQWRRDIRVRRDQVVSGRLTLYGNAKLAGGRLRISTTISQGLGIFGATKVGDLLASRRDADGTFTSVSLWSDWTTDLGSRFSLRLAAQGQLASQPLLIAEETGLGGTAFLRGYDWGERTGDEGVMGMAELRYLIDHPLGLLKRAQIYAYVDGGTLSNLENGFGGGSLASAGGGLRMDMGDRLGATVELAVPLSGRRYDTSNKNPKVNFGVTRSFR